jgi:hypothetical protein
MRKTDEILKVITTRVQIMSFLQNLLSLLEEQSYGTRKHAGKKVGKEIDHVVVHPWKPMAEGELHTILSFMFRQAVMSLVVITGLAGAPEETVKDSPDKTACRDDDTKKQRMGGRSIEVGHPAERNEQGSDKP